MSAKRRRRRETKRIKTKRTRKQLQKSGIKNVGKSLIGAHYGDGLQQGDLDDISREKDSGEPVGDGY